MRSEKYFGRRKETIKKDSKRILTVVIIVAAVFLPAILAGLHYYITVNKPADNRDQNMYVSLYNGEKLLFEENEDPSMALPGGLVAIFNSITADAKEIESSPEEIEKRASLRVSVRHLDVTSEYTIYFDKDSERNYYKNSDGKLFSVDFKKAESFFNSKYSQILYSISTPPILKTTAGDSVVPSKISWKYRNVGGALTNSFDLETESEEITYDMSGNLGLFFDSQPDKCEVEVYKSGIIMYGVDYNNLSTTIVDAGTTLQFKVKAEWEEKENADFCGTVSYNFKVLVRDRAEFFFDKEEYNVGSVALVRCRNIIDPERIEFSAEPNIGYTPEFFTLNESVFAFIPFDIALEGGEYSFTFTYGATKETIPVKVVEHSSSEEIMSGVSENKLSYVLGQADKNGYSFPTIKKWDEHSKRVFCQNIFSKAIEEGSVSYSFGTVFTASGSGAKHTSFGTQYVLEDGKTSESVLAINSGVVAEIGETGYLGKYVIVDHGMGLRSCYAHLSVVNVFEGEIVMASQSIGRTGVLRQVGREGVYLICTVFDVPVDPEMLIGGRFEFFGEDTEDK